MESIARFLFFFAVLYAMYALSALPIGKSGQHELTELTKRAKNNSLIAPFRPIVWLLFLPFNNMFAALAVSLCAFACAGLLLL
jgi:hypothetical protein